jgi:hypothetical protein
MKFVGFHTEDRVVTSSRAAWNGPLASIEPPFHFRPHFGWIGAIEAARNSLAA